MEIKKLEKIKVHCDLIGCYNMADYTITLKRGLFGGNTDLCSACLNELYSLAGKYVVPQSPPNLMNKKELKTNGKK